MDYTRYSREVVILEEKDREFAYRPGEEMKGYLRVETGNGRGAFRCVMQNVKYHPRSEYTYQLILFGTRGERTIHTVIGTIPISRYGTGEVYLRFYPNDVDGQGNDYGRYTTVIVAAVSSRNRSEQLHPVLVGKTGHDAEEETPARPIRAMSEDVTDPPAEERKTYNHFYAEYLKHVCEYLWSVPEYYREIRPFPMADAAERSFLDLKGVRWLKIDDPKTMFVVSPGAQHFTAKYGHFLLGRSAAEEEERKLTYYVAVPGRFQKEDQPDGGTSGFQRWLPLQGDETDQYGYWIAAIDGDTGEIFSLHTP